MLGETKVPLGLDAILDGTSEDDVGKVLNGIKCAGNDPVGDSLITGRSEAMNITSSMPVAEPL